MNLDISSINFDGRKNPKLHLRRRQLKNLKLQENELRNNCEMLKNDCKALELTYNKVSKLAYDNPNAPKVSELWKLKFDMQHSFVYGSYKDYKNARIKYAEEAVKNKELLKYVKQPIQFNQPISIFSKMGRNMAKNQFLDKFRKDTPAEKELKAFYKENAKRDAMHQALGLDRQG